jgi:NUMOD4 motif/HNH endonuclease
MIRREEWRSVAGWPYEVSSFGRVRRTTLENQNRTRCNPNSYEGKILKLMPDKNGYLTVDFRDSTRRLTAKVAQLVCTAFNEPKPPGCRLVRHLDDCKTNNRPHNLRWGTHLENSLDRIRAEKGPLTRIPAPVLGMFVRSYRRQKTLYGKVKRGFILKYAQRYSITAATLWKYANGYSKLVSSAEGQRKGLP